MPRVSNCDNIQQLPYWVRSVPDTVHQGQSFCSFQVNGAIRKQLTPVSREEYHGVWSRWPHGYVHKPSLRWWDRSTWLVSGSRSEWRWKKHLFSFILGPPGTGKTTIARIYARALDAELFELSAVSAGKEDIRKLLGPTSSASSRTTKGKQGSPLIPERPKVLLLDEIHRFNKSAGFLCRTSRAGN